MGRTLPDRFTAKVRVAESGCWEWTAAHHPKQGYGWFKTNGRMVVAHRFAYEALVGPIPEGLVIDHLCRNPRCVNPSHLEPVTTAENVRRGRHPGREKTHCPHGHPYDAENTRYTKEGHRQCRACYRARARIRTGYKGLPLPRDRTHCPSGHAY